ncbi:PD-(D/E)XK motif protein [Stenotrophomonas sp. GD03930]|jgi:hypothetical protein|uniref:PD-(D/E)XK motif protein n=1 Tax=Stenotrophomonas sp. GD03930 TaxID=2975406 RepID=UPI0024479055|nr:PD-(D/E)XK motif protein [Stenotrophomonas sp. GD03930]MDH1231571.1 PD-(D/E)XK motif protein [Stenotrophomonas sp. GD03930]
MSGIDDYRLPPFDEIEAALATEAPRRFGLKTSREVSLITEPEHGALWLLYPADGKALSTVSTTSVIEMSTRRIGHVHYYQIGSQFPPLFREVYYFLCGIVHRAEISQDSFQDVVASELAAWEALLRVPDHLDRNQAIGLLGELFVLWRVLENLGATAIDSWTGPAREQHDFRLSTDDIEVKTTLSHSRDHTISSLDQLTTNHQRSLSVVSIQLKPAGEGPGANLGEAVKKIRLNLADHPVPLKKFNDKLATIGYRHEDDPRYLARYCLRTSPTIVRVDKNFPCITMETLSSSLPSSTLRRITKLTYIVNLDDMGFPLDQAGSPEALRHPDNKDLYA